MNDNNIILNLPFDESAGSVKAYDYSRNRADGNVTDATFAPGKNGNALSSDGGGVCEVSSDIITDYNSDFTFLLWFNPAKCESGAPSRLIWVLNFDGFNSYETVEIPVIPGTWYSVAVVRSGSRFTFYLNTNEIAQVTRTGALLGVSLNQDYYGGEYMMGLLDDVKVFDCALTQEDLIDELSHVNVLEYYLDGVNLKDYGVRVSASNGVLDRPKLKKPLSVSWDNYHGEQVDTRHKFYERREITLKCFVGAESRNEFIQRVSRFEQLFDAPGTHRLMVSVHPIKPLLYEVYCVDDIKITKTWTSGLQVGTFDLKLIEPEPVKRVLKHIVVGSSTSTVNIELKTDKYLSIHWGDGNHTEDVCGDHVGANALSYTYDAPGDYFIVITGCIDEIRDFNTNAIVVWQKL